MAPAIPATSFFFALTLLRAGHQRHLPRIPATTTIPGMNGSPLPFIHLEVHSHYTLLGATPSVIELAQQAAGEGLSHLALTDHQVLYGAIALTRACAKFNLQPLIGMTIDVQAPEPTMAVSHSPSGRLVLLARNREGYRSLCCLTGWLQGNPQRDERVQRGLPWDVLRQHTTGLLCIEGGQRGWLFQLLRAGREQEAGRYLSRLGGLFEEDAYLGLELQRDEERPLLQKAMRIGQRFGLPPLALQPVYALKPDEQELLRLLAAVDHNLPLHAIPSTLLPGQGDAEATVHWLSREEMEERYAWLPQAVTGISALLARCEPALPDGRIIWPALSLPVEQSPEEALAQQAQQGMAERYPPEEQETIAQRLQEELAAINHRGFAPLFLIVADAVRFARQEGIPVSTRGSVANSLVAYCMGITTVDPVAHDLLFTRFLNPARTSLPDIDLDFCSRRRDQVLAYLRRKYGEDRVAMVATINTMRPRSALREAARAYGYSDEAISQLVRRLPRHWDEQPESEIMIVVDEEEMALLQAAKALVGRPHHLGLHPGGVVITPGPLQEYVPVQWARKGLLSTQYDQRDVEKAGLPKIDLLGIRALTVLADATELIQRMADGDFRLETIAGEDEKTGQMLAQGDTIAVFQCESEGARRTLRQLQATSVRDLAIANAFFKPGPAMGGMAQAFIRRYRGEEETALLHPALSDILSPTQGVLIFQEQVLRLAREIAGLTWEQADRLRRGMSKMRPQVMLALRLQFLDGCQRPEPDGPGLSAEQAEQLWEQVVAFGGYGFNQGHATAYADVSYRSAFLKAHYPAQFLCARLANGGGFHHPAVYIAEARRLGLQVRPPHVNHSGRNFTLTYEGEQAVLWMGLGQVRSLRHHSIAAIIDGAPFQSLADLLARIALRDKEIHNLIRCGALDGLGLNRATLLDEAQTMLRAGNAQQMTFGFASPTTIAAESAAQRLAWEMEVLGMPLSVHPLAVQEIAPAGSVSLRRLPRLRGSTATIRGARLPGRTGGSGFFLDDGDSFVVVKTADKQRPPAWTPLQLKGRWRQDQWGGGWFQADSIERLA